MEKKDYRLKLIGRENKSRHMKKEAKDQNKETNFLQDFGAGIDPTGVITFNNATNNKKGHAKHKAAGNVGGFLGGFVISTGLSAAGLAGVAKAVKGRAPELSSYLRQGAKDSLQVLNPRAAIKSLKKIKRATKLVDDTTNLVTTSEKSYGKYKSTGKRDPGFIEKFVEDAPELQNARQEFIKDTGGSPERSLSKGIGIVGGLRSGVLGGSLNSLSAHTQYNAALKLKKENKSKK